MMGSPSSLAGEKSGSPEVEMEIYDSFVLNVKVLGSDAGVGVPTLPVRIPQILDSHNQLNFSKLVEIVIMIASSQAPSSSAWHAASATSSSHRIQHRVLIFFPNPETQNSVMISTSEELLHVMSRYKSQQQMTLIAKVQHEFVPKQPAEEKENVTIPPVQSPFRKPPLSVNQSTVPSLGHERKVLLFDPPKFQLLPTQESPILVSLMEQLLEIQSNRMAVFANHLEDKFQQIIDQRLVTSEAQLRRCLRKTVQLVEEDCKEEDSFASDDEDSTTAQSLSKTFGSTPFHLEKIVKDQMVSMELRFAKLEEQTKRAAALAKDTGNSRTTVVAQESLHQPCHSKESGLDSRLQEMEPRMVVSRQEAEIAKDATMAIAVSPSSNTPTKVKFPGSNSTRSPNRNHRTQDYSELLLPPEHDEESVSLPRPVSPSILSATVPPTKPSPSSQRRSPTPGNVRPVSPPPAARNSLIAPPPLMPLSPPDSRRSSVTTEDADDTVTDTGLPSPCASSDEGDNYDLPMNPGLQDILPMSPDDMQSRHRMSSSSVFSMPSLVDFSVDAPQRKQTVRDMLMAKGDKVEKNKKGNDESTLLPIHFPMLDASRGDLSLSIATQLTPPAKSRRPALTSPTQIQTPPFASPSEAKASLDSATPARPTASETKMKQAIKDHMQSMESRLSKLRELNKQVTVITAIPGTDTLTPVTTLTSPRTLFPDSSDRNSPSTIERILTRKMDSLTETLQSTIEDATKASVDTKMADVEALLQRKLQQIQRASLAISGSEASGSSQRRSAFPDLRVLEELMDGRVDRLADLIQTNQEIVMRAMAVSKTNVCMQDGEGGASVPAAAWMDHLRSVLDERMDTLESLVQLTANEMGNATKATQQRMNQTLLEQIKETLQNRLPSEDESIATTSFPTIYGDEDPSVDSALSHRGKKIREKQDTSDGGHRRGRSLEADLVALDRQASILDIYGEMDIDDEDLGSCADVTGHSRESLGRGRSLRDLCNIDTIEEEDGDEGEDVTSRVTDPGTVQSFASEIFTRSSSLKHVYGDDGVDIDGDQKVAGPAEANGSSDTSPVKAKRSFSARTLMARAGIVDRHQDFSDLTAEHIERAPWRADQAEASKKVVPPSPVRRALLTQSINEESMKKDGTAQLVDDAVSTSDIYGEQEIDVSMEKEIHRDILQTQARRADISVSAGAIIGGEAEDAVETAATSVTTGLARHSDTFEFYENIDIDIVADQAPEEYRFTSGEEDDVYDNLSLDGVEETHAFVSALDGSSDDSDSDLDDVNLEDEEKCGEEDADQISVSIDENSVPSSMSSIDSESNKDHGYLLDNAQHYLAVMANAIARVRAAEKATCHYKTFQENILISKRDGPLANKVKSVADCDAAEGSGHEVSLSDDESPGDNFERSTATGTGVIAHDDDDESGTTDSYESYRNQYNRSKARALVIAVAVAALRAANRHIRDNRKMLRSKFTPRRRKGPMALNERSASADSALEDTNSSSCLPAAGPYTCDDDDKYEPLAASIPSIDTGDSIDEAFERDIDLSGRQSLSNASTHSQPELPIGVADKPGDLEGQRETDGVWEKTLQDEEDSHSEESTTPVGYCLELIKPCTSQIREETTTGMAANLSPSNQGKGKLSSTIFRRIEPFEAADAESSGIQATSSSNALQDSPVKEDNFTSRQNDFTIHFGEQTQATTPPLCLVLQQFKPEYATLSDAAGNIDRSNEKHVANVEVLDHSQDIAWQHQEAPYAVWSAVANIPTSQLATRSPPRSSLDETKSVEECAIKPKQMPKPPPQSSPTTRGQKSSWKPNDESQCNLDDQTKFNLGEEEKEFEEWEAIATKQASPMRDPLSQQMVMNSALGESKYYSDGRGRMLDSVGVLVLEHLQEMQTQIQKWENNFLNMSHDQKASNGALRLSNENLQTRVQESIEDSHHFAAYLDKMVTERIGQLERAIQSQMAIVAQSLVSRNELVHLSTALVTSSPARVLSAPTSPMHETQPALREGGSSTNLDGKGKDSDRIGRETIEGKRLPSMVVEVANWKHLQDKLRGTEEVAEAYRTQVLQLQSVLEMKINEGNASQHLVEVLQRKLQDAHDREVLAQKQLRPVTRRVEQVIQEMVHLEEYSASLKAENVQLRDQLWLAQREC